MFEFNRGGTDYTIQYSENFLICSYFDAVLNRSRWVTVSDTDDLDGVYKSDEVEFLEEFLGRMNNSLDEYHKDVGEGPEDPESSLSRLTYLIKTGLSFNEETQHVELS